jgi:hypothetical protein
MKMGKIEIVSVQKKKEGQPESNQTTKASLDQKANKAIQPTPPISRPARPNSEAIAPTGIAKVEEVKGSPKGGVAGLIKPVKEEEIGEVTDMMKQYRAVGILWGKVKAKPAPPPVDEPEENLIEGPPGKKKKFREEYLLEVDGKVYEVFNKKYTLKRYIEKNIGKECFWKVYPWYRVIFEDGKPAGRVLGFELNALISDQERSGIPVKSGYFSIKGVISEVKRGAFKVKVYRNDMVNKYNKPPKFIDEERTRRPPCTKIEVKGSLPPSKRKLGWFWDIEVLLDGGGEFNFTSGKPIMMIHEIKKPDHNKTNGNGNGTGPTQQKVEPNDVPHIPKAMPVKKKDKEDKGVEVGTT